MQSQQMQIIQSMNQNSKQKSKLVPKAGDRAYAKSQKVLYLHLIGWKNLKFFLTG